MKSRGGGGVGASGPINEKWGGGGGGPFRFRSDTFGHTENIYVTQAENFTYIGCIA